MIKKLVFFTLFIFSISDNAFSIDLYSYFPASSFTSSEECSGSGSSSCCTTIEKVWKSDYTTDFKFIFCNGSSSIDVKKLEDIKLKKSFFDSDDLSSGFNLPALFERDGIGIWFNCDFDGCTIKSIVKPL